jgi:hypothetical protein
VSGTAAARPVFDALYLEAERARWKLADLRWEQIEREHVTPELVQLVRDIAESEATTFSATQRFLQDFADDVELTNWISVWFYEETKHPHVLFTWLDAVGAGRGNADMRRARVTAPFMKSRMGTLVTNIISEIVASSRYMNLSTRTPEPVLAQIATRLAADEARHAASFYTFAHRRIAAASDPDAERRDALKVVYLWINESERVHHPVNLFATTQASAAAVAAVRSRVIRTIGLLVGAPLRDAADVMSELKGGSNGSS